MHTLTTNLLTLIAVHPRHAREALSDIGVLGAFVGTLVHDGHASYDGFEPATPAQCGAHLIRHLKDVGQSESHAASSRVPPRREGGARSERTAW
jgi:hypothetical protein